MDPEIDLVVPECNAPTLERKIIANPNCSTIQSVVPLRPLHDAFGLKRVAYTTYQAVSGSGQAGINDLRNGEKGKLQQTTHTQFTITYCHILMYF